MFSGIDKWHAISLVDILSINWRTILNFCLTNKRSCLISLELETSIDDIIIQVNSVLSILPCHSSLFVPSGAHYKSITNTITATTPNITKMIVLFAAQYPFCNYYSRSNNQSCIVHHYIVHNCYMCRSNMCKTYNSIMNSYIVDSIQTMMPTQMQMTPTFSEAYPF